MSPDRLVYMANQIGKFFQSQGHDKAVPGIADHIKKFWDPRMRKAILAHLDSRRRRARSRRARCDRDAEAGLERVPIASRAGPIVWTRSFREPGSTSLEYAMAAASVKHRMLRHFV